MRSVTFSFIFLYLLIFNFGSCYHVDPSFQLEMNENNFTHFKKFFAKPKKSSDSTKFTDSLGGVSLVADIDKKHTCTMKGNTILYHKSSVSGTKKEFMYDADFSFFTTPDVFQAIAHESDRGDTKEATLHMFVLQKSIPNLVYFIENKYDIWDASHKVIPSGYNYLGRPTNIHVQLVTYVCKTLKMLGWRAPWDQDELMLCGGLSKKDHPLDEFSMTIPLAGLYNQITTWGWKFTTIGGPTDTIFHHTFEKITSSSSAPVDAASASHPKTKTELKTLIKKWLVDYITKTYTDEGKTFATTSNNFGLTGSEDVTLAK